ncbi:glutamine--fructose-6-phosphate transaminase (isomerizing) [Pseudohoeflea suaedae]|uniref:Glutamine--fructose-6-phosphate aminotransferase [isomerizing] n=1 Tax=Pseudohoeflea suaedae TaxID=877384 RepID=A0A4R5PQT0_9HYPH|nr:glutamine--fructose-6-phosphate transaminase (isomerizing) [Pseudohoeflea suaedae]TDH39318.1 glutamine--fructose-6-phosphate transaminase (isomerizing) [Pseudohoeflea suaedae]
MCGIVGIIGGRDVAPLLVDALKRLEYRGYDSAGVATLQDGKLDRRRAEGKLGNLEGRLASNPLPGHIGIGHTRWATHGAPTENNAHPHFAGRVAVVHNGIIENFASLRRELTASGAEFVTQTDTEVVAHLVSHYLSEGMASRDAARAAISRLEGAYALAILFSGDDEEMIVGARNGPPLAVGHGKDEMYLGSDAIALAPFTDEVTYLEDGDWCVVTRAGAEFYDASGRQVERARRISRGAAYVVDKGNHKHFMEKEIYEQPEVISHTLSHYIDFAEGKAKPIEGIDFANLDRLAISACGTAYYAGLIAKYWFERYARLPVEIDVASEFRYREMPLTGKMAALFVSQSGETADTLASLRYCKSEGVTIGAVVNVPESTIARESDAVFPTLAGPEIGVASTKAFTCQLSVLAALAIAAGKARGTLSDEQEAEMVQALVEGRRVLGEVLREIQPRIEALSRDLSHFKDVLYLGRGTNFPLALEGALKLKEISYIHAEGYAAGELKHGPIALIDEDMPVIVIAPHDQLYEKTVSNMQEVAARGGRIVLITDERGARETALQTMETIVLPQAAEIVTPLLYALPVQLIAYHTAVFMGTDVDQPRNLAKSVTVE